MKKKSIIWLIGLIVSFIVFLNIFITIVNMHGAALEIDTKVHDYFINVRGEKGNPLYYITNVITQLGSSYFFILCIFAICIIYKGNYKALAFFIGACLVVILNQGIKRGVCRFRPSDIYYWTNEDGYSFPSGHSMISSYLAVFGIYMLYDFKLKKSLRISLTVLFSLLIIIIPCTRLILAVHYFTDVVAGSILSICISLIVFELINQFKTFNVLPNSIIIYLKNKLNKTKESN